MKRDVAVGLTRLIRVVRLLALSGESLRLNLNDCCFNNLVWPTAKLLNSFRAGIKHTSLDQRIERVCSKLVYNLLSYE